MKAKGNPTPKTDFYCELGMAYRQQESDVSDMKKAARIALEVMGDADTVDVERQGDRLFALRQLHDLVHQFYDKWHAEFFNASNNGKPPAA
jgi:hypothetical protein